MICIEIIWAADKIFISRTGHSNCGDTLPVCRFGRVGFELKGHRYYGDRAFSTMSTSIYCVPSIVVGYSCNIVMCFVQYSLTNRIRVKRDDAEALPFM